MVLGKRTDASKFTTLTDSDIIYHLFPAKSIHMQVFGQLTLQGKIVRQRRNKAHTKNPLNNQIHTLNLELVLHRLLHRCRRLLRPLHLLLRHRRKPIRNHDLARSPRRRRSHLINRLTHRDSQDRKQLFQAVQRAQWQYHRVQFCGYEPGCELQWRSEGFFDVFDD